MGNHGSIISKMHSDILQSVRPAGENSLTVYTVHCAVWSVHCTLYSVQCIYCCVYYKVYILQCTLNSIQCRVNGMQATGEGVQCTVYSAHCAGIQCTLYSEQSIANSEKYSVYKYMCIIYGARRKVYYVQICVYTLPSRCTILSSLHFC